MLILAGSLQKNIEIPNSFLKCFFKGLQDWSWSRRSKGIQAWNRQLCCCDTFHLVLVIPAESSRIILSDQTSEEIPPSHGV